MPKEVKETLRKEINTLKQSLDQCQDENGVCKPWMKYRAKEIVGKIQEFESALEQWEEWESQGWFKHHANT